MRNLFLFFWRFHFFILFLLLEVAALYLLVKNNNYHNASFLNSSNEVAANMLATVNNVNEYLHLKDVNESMARENSELLGLIPSYYFSTQSDTGTVRDTTLHQQYYFITAKVINNSVNRRSNYMTLNKGLVHGIKPEMGVITSNGVVGIVKDVSENFCTVLSLLHKETRISSKIKNINFFGSLTWPGTDPELALLNDIPKNAVFAVGDTVFTSGYSAIFPQGVMLGTIKESRIDPGDNFHNITVKLSVNFYTLTHVYAIENILKTEQIKLEEATNGN